MVGAGAVVTKNVLEYTTVVGSPAKPIQRKKSVGIIGCGTVGGAIIAALNKSSEFDIVMCDKFKQGSEYKPIKDLENCDLVFISVPTPFSEEIGGVDLSPVVDSVSELSDSGFSGVLVIKSTIPPGTTRSLHETYRGMTIMFNPEFLREKTAVIDFYNQKNIIIGLSPGDLPLREPTKIVELVFAEIINDFKSFKNMIQYTSYETAEMVKYSQNIMYASRVAICNILFDACQELNVNYDDVKEMAFYNEPSIGSSVVEVPGPDGKRGFGGKCLPKDLAGFNGKFKNKVLDAILKYNKELGREIE